jgi:hypothetical protein
MSKKDDLKIVFDFIADYLREEQPKAITSKELLIEDKEPKIIIDKEFGEILVKTKTPIDNVGADVAHINHIKQLIERVETKSVEQATVNNLLANQKREFEQEIKKLKDKVSEELIAEKISEENIDSSATTLNVVIENDSKTNITDDSTTNRILGKR